MKAADKELVLRAQASLKLRDIKLFSCKLERDPSGDQSKPGPLKEQFKKGASYTKAQKRIGEKEITVLLVRVDLGIRVGSKAEDGSDNFLALFVIEADYLVEYELKEDVDEDALTVFAKYNVVHNVWPFWRQHVFDVVGRARLPHVPIPFFPGENL